MPKENQLLVQQWLERPRNFFIYLGRAGCGKTYLTAAMMNYLYPKALERNPFVEFYFYPQDVLLQAYRTSYGKSWDDWSTKDKVMRANLLAIDDFGSTRNNEWQRDEIWEIVRFRSAEHKLTIFSSNLEFAEIEEHFYPRVRSRLEADENTIIYDWETDHRITKE